MLPFWELKVDLSRFMYTYSDTAYGSLSSLHHFYRQCISQIHKLKRIILGGNSKNTFKSIKNYCFKNIFLILILDKKEYNERNLIYFATKIYERLLQLNTYLLSRDLVRHQFFLKKLHQNRTPCLGS